MTRGKSIVIFRIYITLIPDLTSKFFCTQDIHIWWEFFSLDADFICVNFDL